MLRTFLGKTVVSGTLMLLVAALTGALMIFLLVAQDRQTARNAAMLQLAKTCARLIDGDKHAMLIEPNSCNSDYYIKTQQLLQAAAKTVPQVDFLFTIILKPNTDQLVYGINITEFKDDTLLIAGNGFLLTYVMPPNAQPYFVYAKRKCSSAFNMVTENEIYRVHAVNNPVNAVYINNTLVFSVADRQNLVITTPGSTINKSNCCTVFPIDLGSDVNEVTLCLLTAGKPLNVPGTDYREPPYLKQTAITHIKHSIDTLSVYRHSANGPNVTAANAVIKDSKGNPNGQVIVSHYAHSIWQTNLTLLYQLLLAVGLITITGYGVIVFWGQRFRQRLSYVQNYLNRIKDDNLSLQPPAMFFDEFDQLTKSLHTLSGQLKITRQDLQQNVAHKTNELQQTLNRYRLLAENSLDVVFSINNLTELTYISPAASQMLSQQPSTLLGKKLSQALELKSDEKLQLHLMNSQAQERPTPLIVKTNFAHLSTQWLELQVTPAPQGGYTGSIRNITAQYKAELELEQRTQLFNEILTDSKTFIYRFNYQKNCFDYVSDSICDFRGESRVSLLAQTEEEDRNHIHPQDIPKIVKKLSTIQSNPISNRVTAYVEYRRQDAWGAWRWLGDWITIYLDDNKYPLYAIGNANDITENKLAELNLKKSDQRFNEVLSTAKLLTYKYNIAQDHFEWISDYCLELTGLKREEIEHRSFGAIAKMFLPQDRFRFMRKIKALAKKCPEQTCSSNIQYQLTTRNNKQYWLHDWFTITINQQNQTVSVIGSAFDITSSRLSEEALKESAKRMHRVLSATSDGVWEIDLKTYSIYYSPEYCQMLGYGPDFKPQSIDFSLNAMPPQDQEIFFEWIVKLYHGEDRLIYERRMFHKDGHVLWILNRGQVVERDQNNIPLKVVGTITDISAIKKALQDLNQAKQEAEAANLAKSRFIASVSHELRTPLNAILGYTQLLANPNPPIDHRQALQVIDSSSKLLLNLINEVLDLSKIEAGKVELNQAPTNLNKLLAKVVAMAEPKARQQGLDFDLEQHPGLPQWFTTDEIRLSQVLMNLLNNAIKYTTSGRVSLIVSSIQNQLNFTVSDTGAGILDTEQEKIFEPFHQVAGGNTKSDGVGLGLAISQGILHVMGTSLTLKSSPGKGSSFSFSLPLQDLSHPDLPPAQPIISGYKGARKHVLLIHSNQGIRQTLFGLLKTLDFVTFLVDYPDNILHQQSINPDLILLNIDDCPEPKEQVVSELNSVWPMVPVIGLQNPSLANVNTPDINGLACTLKQPVDFTDLLTAIKQQLKLQWIYGKNQTPQQQITDKKLIASLLASCEAGDIELIGKQLQQAQHLYPKLNATWKLFSDWVNNFELENIIHFLNKQNR